MTFRLTKHHGLGNDFLVFLTDDPAVLADDAWWERAQRWCDRHTGVGADGLLLGLHGRPGADLHMVLHNADGSLAEMSGNGIRCLAQAEARRRHQVEGKLTIETGGGLRSVVFGPDPQGREGWLVASVDLGPARPGPTPDRDREEAVHDAPAVPEALALDALAGGTYDLGNPHLVLHVPDPVKVDPVAAGQLHERTYDDGINVHFIAPTPGATDEIDLVVWERGAGVTGACGTGAAAAARAAHDWGLTGERVTVHMPGGDAVVDVGDPMVLHGPAAFIADVEVPA
ncbi:MAG TPA: diaminopimelate epimerase [Aquihabitans sp.]|jgi:diaminopimelate epimerase|nr:diaminopimelate epimerase [Aquihabitans sp.]